MVKRVILLLRLSFKKPLFGSSKNKRSSLLVPSLLGVLLIVYSLLISFGLKAMDSSSSIPSVLFLVASIMVFVFGFQLSTGILFDSKDYESLMSLPFNGRDILVSRFISLYVYMETFVLLWMIPGMIVYFSSITGAASLTTTIIISLLSLPFVPLIPLTVVSILATLLLSLTSRMKHRNLIGNILSLILILAMAVGPSVVSSMVGNNPSMGQNLTDSMTVAQTYYFPLGFFSKGIAGDWLYWLYFFLTSIGMFSVFAFGVSFFFLPISSSLQGRYAKRNFVSKEEKEGGVTIALLKKEFHGYFSSRIYVLNTMLGGIIFVVFAFIFPLIYGKSSADNGNFLPMIAKMFPFIGALFMGLSVTTAPSLSMEGKRYWILESLPIKATDVYKAKILMSLIVCFPFYLAGVIVANFTMPFSVSDRVYMALFPFVGFIAFSIIGLFLGQLKANFDFKNEAEAVKQNPAILIQMIAEMLFAIAAAVPYILLQEPYSHIAPIAVMVLEIVVAIVCYFKINKVELNQVGCPKEKPEEAR